MSFKHLPYYCTGFIMTTCCFCNCRSQFSSSVSTPTKNIARYFNINDSDHIFKDYVAIISARIDRLIKLKHSDKIYSKVATRSDASLANKDSSLSRTDSSLTLWEKLSLTIRALKKIRRGMQEIGKSDVRYRLFYTTGNSNFHGVTTADTSTGEILIEYKTGTAISDEVIGHEIIHAIQYEKGKISIGIKKGNSRGSLYDISDETEAYWCARVAKYNLSDGDSVNDAWVIKRFPEYDSLPRTHVSIHSKTGRKLRRSTVNAGINNTSFTELYKGWQKDYEKGCKQFVGNSGKISDTCFCLTILKTHKAYTPKTLSESRSQ